VILLRLIRVARTDSSGVKGVFDREKRALMREAILFSVEE